MNRLLQSSANSQNLSLTVKGLLIGLVPFIIYLAQTQEIYLTNIDLISYIDRFTFVLAEVVVFVGLMRKAYYVLRDLKK